MKETPPNLKVVDNTEQREIWGMENLSNLIESGGGDEFDKALVDAYKLGQVDEPELAQLALKLAKKHRIELNEAKKQVLLDPLTNLPNRRALEIKFKALSEALYSNKEKRKLRMQSLMVIFLDLDSFKSLNDKYGHDVGDRGLVEFAHKLKSSTREDTDIVVRLGGDEFLIMLPIYNDSKEDGMEPVVDHERIFMGVRDKLEGLSIKAVHQGDEEVVVPITASMGYAISERGDKLKTLEELKKEADAQMYAAKKEKNGAQKTN